MATETLTRKELYDLVWSTPFTVLSKKYLISDVGLKKTCKRMVIPTPIAGHWAKIKAKMNVKVIQLSKDYSGKETVVFNLRPEKDEGPSPADLLETEINNTMGEWLVVNDRLSKPHKLISEAQERLTNKRTYISNGLLNTHAGELAIKVAPSNVGRALRFLNTFFKLLIQRGHDIIIKNNSTYITIFGEEMELSFKERCKRLKIAAGEKHPLETYEYTPTGILDLTIRVGYSHCYSWIDGKILIEQKLASVLACVEISGQELKERNLQREKERLIQEEENKKAHELEKRKEIELHNFKQILQKAKQWQEAELVRNYLNSIESKDNLTEEKKNWIDWARKKADWYDPQINSSDELLNDVNKENLTLVKKSFWSY